LPADQPRHRRQGAEPARRCRRAGQTARSGHVRGPRRHRTAATAPARRLRPRLPRPPDARSRPPGDRTPRTHRDAGGPAMNAVEAVNSSTHCADVIALQDVSLALAKGRVHGWLGANGAGKTTLTKLLTGQLFASTGEMRELGENPVENARVLTQTCI